MAFAQAAERRQVYLASLEMQQLPLLTRGISVLTAIPTHSGGKDQQITEAIGEVQTRHRGHWGTLGSSTPGELAPKLTGLYRPHANGDLLGIHKASRQSNRDLWCLAGLCKGHRHSCSGRLPVAPLLPRPWVVAQCHIRPGKSQAARVEDRDSGLSRGNYESASQLPSRMPASEPHRLYL
jgi:hypothetical protein